MAPNIEDGVRRSTLYSNQDFLKFPSSDLILDYQGKQAEFWLQGGASQTPFSTHLFRLPGETEQPQTPSSKFDLCFFITCAVTSYLLR